MRRGLYRAVIVPAAGVGCALLAGCEPCSGRRASHMLQVVNVSSVTHRYGWVGDVATFLPSWRPGSYYPSTKLVGAGRPGAAVLQAL